MLISLAFPISGITQELSLEQIDQLAKKKYRLLLALQTDLANEQGFDLLPPINVDDIQVINQQTILLEFTGGINRIPSQFGIIIAETDNQRFAKEVITSYQYPFLGSKVSFHHQGNPEFGEWLKVKAFDIGQQLLDFQQDLIPLQLELIPSKPRFIEGQPVELTVRLHNRADNHFETDDLSSESIIFFLEDKRILVSKDDFLERKVLKSGEYFERQFVLKDIPKTGNIYLSALYEQQFKGVNPIGSTKVEIIPK